MLPDKEWFCVAEVTPRLARILGVSDTAAQQRIYRAIADGSLRARRFLGATRLPRSEVIRIVEGEDPM